jgi:hypothetical protein
MPSKQEAASASWELEADGVVGEHSLHVRPSSEDFLSYGSRMDSEVQTEMRDKQPTGSATTKYPSSDEHGRKLRVSSANRAAFMKELSKLRHVVFIWSVENHHLKLDKI